MKKILLLFFSLVFILCADWESDVTSIKTNTYNSKESLSQIELSNDFILDAAIKQSQGLGLSIEGSLEGGNLRVVKDTLPNGLNSIANKYSIIKDNTFGYNYYIFGRQFGTTHLEELETTWDTDNFFGQEFSLKNIDTVDNHFFNDSGVGVNFMYENTPTLYQGRQIVNSAATLINGYLNTTYEDYTFFTLDLSSLGGMFQNWGLIEGTVNPFENWVFKCNLVPDELNNPFLFKIHSSLQTFYNVYYGKFIIQICFSMYLVMLLWHKVINVFNID